ncbi:MAG: hypothetical protein HC792_00325 [Acaryochloridaceae cyanobacterium CSU_5_19]|nr:hypothetical protein [Acaryochloridaceae cyanobacterium CSU_5_19]
MILTAAIASLWLLRRAVIHEVTEVAQRHLRELRDLKGHLADAIEAVDLVLQKTDRLDKNLDQEAQQFESGVEQ